MSPRNLPDALTLAGDQLSSNDRVRNPGRKDFSGLTEEGALSLAARSRSEDHAASVGVASWSVTYGGCGGPGEGWKPSKAWRRRHKGVSPDSVPRCTSPGHGEHLAAARDDLIALKLIEDPVPQVARTDLGFRSGAKRKRAVPP